MLFQYGGPHRTFHSNVKHRGIGVFFSSLFTPLADIAFLLNRKKRQCDKYYNGSQILKCHRSKTFTLFTVYFRHTIPRDYRCSVRKHKLAGPNPGPFSRRLEVSLCQPSSGWLSGAAKRETLAPYFICFVQDTLDL